MLWKRLHCPTSVRFDLANLFYCAHRLSSTVHTDSTKVCAMYYVMSWVDLLCVASHVSVIRALVAKAPGPERQALRTHHQEGTHTESTQRQQTPSIPLIAATFHTLSNGALW